ncbi:MAG: flagellar basal body P-ring protein FlgI, partial [Gemmatimonadetes bacterium]|nr:flagellar basal body P-ring protein FlgI [Gemmatimonadota bacterium]
MHRLNITCLLFCLLALSANDASAAVAVRIKDLARLQTGQEVPLTGMGLVIGLEGTGDGRQASFTLRMLANMMNRLNLTVDPNAIRVRNVAAVSATAVLSPYDRTGNKIDVQVASLGDAGSLQGGTLLLTPMAGPDGKVYAQVQGSISIGGFNLGGGGAGTVRKNHSVVGTIPNGGTVVSEPERLINVDGHVQLTLYQPDWTTAARTAWAIDEYFGEFGLAQAVDAGTIQIRLDPQYSQSHLLTEFMADIEKITVVPDLPARVVVNERTGTVIIGENVSVSSVALSHGALRL